MATQTKRLTELPADELAQLLALVAGSDSVELKLTVPEAEQRSAVAALGLDPLEAQIRQVFFFDTPEPRRSTRAASSSAPAGSRAGGRRLGREAAPGRPGRAPRRHPALAELRGRGRRDARRLRLLRLHEGRVASADVREAVLGERRFGSCSPRSSARSSPPTRRTGIGLDDLTILGPIFVLKLSSRRPRARRRLVVELWLYPDGLPGSSSSPRSACPVRRSRQRIQARALPRGSRPEPLRRSAAEDEDRARVLRRRAPRGAEGRMSPTSEVGLVA